MKHAIPFIGLLVLGLPLHAGEFRHFADFILKSRTKIVGTEVKPIPIKPVVFQVFTDGVKVRVSVEGNADGRSTFDIYRSDGIARKIPDATKLDIMPGLQATSNSGGVLRHLRLTRESMTITTFPGRSDQTTVTYAVTTSAGTTRPEPGNTVSFPPINP
jgi:hypothetical protein